MAMALSLSDHEAGKKYDGDYRDDLAALQTRLEHLQAAHITHGQRSIILFEGWHAGGKDAIIRRLCAALDPRYFQVWRTDEASGEEKEQHFLWRFWQRLPGRCDIAVFDRSWYRRVLADRVNGVASEADWRKAFDEINEFEAQMIGSGSHLVKLFTHVTQDQQDRRLAERLDDRWQRWKCGPEDFHARTHRTAYREAFDEMFAQTDTRWAPWHVVDGNDEATGQITALTHIVETLEAKVPMTMPDADPAIVKLARTAFGYAPKT